MSKMRQNISSLLTSPVRSITTWMHDGSPALATLRFGFLFFKTGMGLAGGRVACLEPKENLEGAGGFAR